MTLRMILKEGQHSVARSLVMLVALGVCLTTQAFGADKTWNKSGVGNWSDGANWTGGGEPVSGEKASINNGGTALCEAGEICGYLTLGFGVGESGTVRLDDAADSLTNTTTAVILGTSGTGTLYQANGLFHNVAGMKLGGGASGYGEYVLSGGVAYFRGDFIIGSVGGVGKVRQSGGVFELHYPGVGNSRFIQHNGLYELTGGSMSVGQSLTLGATAGQRGRFVVNGLTAVMGITNSASVNGVAMTVGNAGEGTLEVVEGTILVDGNFIVGNTTTGTVTQTGGTLSLSRGKGVTLGSATNGVGTYELFGGTLCVDVGAWPDRALIVGNSGKGSFKMGDASGCGVLTQALAGAGMRVGWNAGSSGTFRGWSGEGVDSKFYLTGTLYLYNGLVIADGYGVDRSLDLTRFNSVVNNGLDSPTNGVSGWFAQNHGKLIMKSGNHNSFKKVHYWGESVSDTTPDLINSAFMTFVSDQTVPVIGQLYATDRTDVPSLSNVPGNSVVISVHQFTGTMSTYDLTICYDHTAVAAAELEEARLNLYQWSGSAWTKLTTALDTVNRRISATGVSGDGFVVIAALPTPPKGILIIIR